MNPPRLSTSSHPLVKHKLGLLRESRTDSRLFRELLDELAMLLAYETTQQFALREVDVHTPLAKTTGLRLAERVGLVPILRAGLGLSAGFLRVLPQAQVWHLGLSRDEQTLRPVEYYNRLPSRATVDQALLLDPMLATGHSAIAAVDVLRRWGCPRISFVGVIASPEGIAAFHEHHPDVPIHVAAIDERLTTDSDGVPPGYIWPGLGDAGDRQFGTEVPPAAMPTRSEPRGAHGEASGAGGAAE